jgi:hypothetical protein
MDSFGGKSSEGSKNLFSVLKMDFCSVSFNLSLKSLKMMENTFLWNQKKKNFLKYHFFVENLLELKIIELPLRSPNIKLFSFGAKRLEEDIGKKEFDWILGTKKL